MTATSIHTEIEAARTAAQPEAALVARFRAYAAGRQRNTLAPLQRRILTAVLGNRHTDNLCRLVLQRHAARAQLLGWTVNADPVAAWLTDLWTRVAGPALQGRTHWATLRDGNAAIALAWDPIRAVVRLVREPWWDGTRGVWVAYGPDDLPTYAVKDWADERGRRRRILWWPDRIERFIADGAGWMPAPRDPTARTTWQDAWVDTAGAPLGLPVVHFANSTAPPDLAETDSSYGTSILDGGPLGVQDEANDVHRDITGAARLTGYQMYYGTGVQTEKDAAGQPLPIEVGPGKFLISTTPGAFGTLPAGDLKQLELALLIKIQAMSRDTDTPIHLITGGDWPSGAALEMADAPLIAATDAFTAALSPAWGSLAHKATVLQNVFGGGVDGAPLDTTALIRPVWASATPVNRAAAITQAVQAAPLVSEEEALRLAGYAEDKVKQIMKERNADTARRDALVFATGAGNGQ